MFRDFEVEGYGGQRIRLRSWEGRGGCAVVLPGAMYPPTAPLLYVTRLAVQETGLAVLELDASGDYRLEAAEANARAALSAAPGDVRLLVGKSISTVAMARLGLALPAIWLTPLCRPEVVEAIGRAPALVIAGDRDEAFDPAVLPDAVVIEGGDHSLEVGGDAVAFARVLVRVAQETRAFLSEAVGTAAGP